MIKAEISESSNGKKEVKVSMHGNAIECTNDAVLIVAGLYHALKDKLDSEIFADVFCDALHEDVFKGDKELEEATRKTEEQATDEADDFLRKFMDALTR